MSTSCTAAWASRLNLIGPPLRISHRPKLIGQSPASQKPQLLCSGLDERPVQPFRTGGLKPLKIERRLSTIWGVIRSLTLTCGTETVLLLLRVIGVPPPPQAASKSSIESVLISTFALVFISVSPLPIRAGRPSPRFIGCAGECPLLPVHAVTSVTICVSPE